MHHYMKLHTQISPQLLLHRDNMDCTPRVGAIYVVACGLKHQGGEV